MITLLIVLAVIGFAAYALVTWVPMSDGFKRLIVIVAIVLAVAYVLYAMNILPIRDPGVPQLR